jgi:hypothetical protein
VSDVLDPITAQADVLADVGLMSDAELFAGLAAIAENRCVQDAVEAAMLAELDARDAADREWGLRTFSWLSRETGVSPATAKARLGVAAALHRWLPQTAAGLLGAEISFDHAKVLAQVTNERNADAIAGVEAELLGLAALTTFDRWARHVRDLAAMLDADGGYDPHSDVMNNRLRLTTTPDGTFVNGRLVGPAALTVDQVINTVADELYRQYVTDSEHTRGEIAVPNRATLRALALEEICRRAAGGTPDRPPIVEATLVVDAAEPDRVVDQHGNPITFAQWGALLCVASLYPIVVDHLGVPLDMGREIRSPNRHQRRALNLRDGGCVFPGCGARPEHCDAHHVDHWTRDHGRTDVKRLALLCRHHHGVIHRKGWNIAIGDDGWTWITARSGRAMWGQQHGTQRAGPAPPSPP